LLSYIVISVVLGSGAALKDALSVTLRMALSIPPPDILSYK
jgi:hypothetical protein